MVLPTVTVTRNGFSLIEDGDEEFQHPLGPGILTVGYGESVLRIHRIPEFPADKFIRLGGKSLPSRTAAIRFSLFLCIPGFQACSDSPFVLVRGSRNKLPHHLLILDRPGFAHQPYASDPGEVLFQISSLSGLFWNGWYYGLKYEWRLMVVVGAIVFSHLLASESIL